MRKLATTLTERGQVSMPASIRKALSLKPGQQILWERISENECRIVIAPRPRARGPVSVVGAAKKARRHAPATTREWMSRLRAGER